MYVPGDMLVSSNERWAVMVLSVEGLYVNLYVLYDHTSMNWSGIRRCETDMVNLWYYMQLVPVER